MGPEFGDLRPLGARGTYEPFVANPAYSYGGIDNGVIHPVVSASAPSLDCFREGETLLVYLEVGFPALVAGQPTPVYVSGLRCKFWWARSATEFRSIGHPPTGNPILGSMGGVTTPPSPVDVDHANFGGWSVFNMPFDLLVQTAPINLLAAASGGGAGLGNRNVYFPTPKRLDIVPPLLGSSPTNFSLFGTSDSLLLDEVFLAKLPNPTSVPWSAAPWNTPGSDALRPPNFRVRTTFVTPVYGRSFGVSFESVLAYVSTDAPVPYPVSGQPVPPGPNGGTYPTCTIGFRSGVTNSVAQPTDGSE